MRLSLVQWQLINEAKRLGAVKPTGSQIAAAEALERQGLMLRRERTSLYFVLTENGELAYQNKYGKESLQPSGEQR